MTWRDQIVTALFDVVKNDPKEERKQRARQILIEDWRQQITEQYFKALTLALPEDGKASRMPLWGSMQDWVAYEAASRYVAIVEARGAEPHEKIRLSVAKATVKSFNDLPRPDGITPIIFGLGGESGLSTLVDDARVSRFDLDGTGRPSAWTWVQPSTGILVWDPRHSGRITSGRQLFGSASWWLLFNNGYEALDVLDDNRDRELSGAELKGLSVWFDRNSNGVSDSGEVIPVEQLGIAGISTTPTGMDGKSPFNAAGLRLTDGRVLPTYDWIAESVPVSMEHQPTTVLSVVVAGLVMPIFLAARRRRASA